MPNKGESVSASPDVEAIAASDEPAAEPRRGCESRGGGGRNGGPGGAGNGRFDPTCIFTGRDTNMDSKLTEDEVVGGRMADLMKEFDNDGDGAITQDDFRTSISRMFSGGRRSGSGGEGGHGYRGRGEDTRPDRPKMAG